MNLTLEERETFLRTNDQKVSVWELFTLSPRFAKRLEKLGYALNADHQGGWSCQIASRFITIRKPVRRVMSDKQRENIRLAQQKRKALSVTACQDKGEGEIG